MGMYLGGVGVFFSVLSQALLGRTLHLEKWGCLIVITSRGNLGCWI